MIRGFIILASLALLVLNIMIVVSGILTGNWYDLSMGILGIGFNLLALTGWSTT